MYKQNRFIFKLLMVGSTLVACTNPDLPDTTTTQNINATNSANILIPSGVLASAPPDASNILLPSAGRVPLPEAPGSADSGPPPSVGDISTVETTTLGGTVMDSKGPVNGAKVIVRSLDSSVNYDAETLTKEGKYQFNNAPSGVKVEIVVTYSDGTTQKQSGELQSNKAGDPNVNQFNFKQE